jgi:hypothetical protein
VLRAAAAHTVMPPADATTVATSEPPARASGGQGVVRHDMPRAMAHAAAKRDLVAIQRPVDWEPPRPEVVTESELANAEAELSALQRQIWNCRSANRVGSRLRVRIEGRGSMEDTRRAVRSLGSFRRTSDRRQSGPQPSPKKGQRRTSFGAATASRSSAGRDSPPCGDPTNSGMKGSKGTGKKIMPRRTRAAFNFKIRLWSLFA